ncbi:MAG: glutaminase [Herbinix sp.]|jgi:hypothetical protein|nr:glutaminase [Herbinix sp.]
MKLRAPAVPLITVDPYFSIWSMHNQLNADVTRHWTGKQHRLTGILEVDDTSYCFMGLSPFTSMKQKSLEIDALSTKYVFTIPGIELKVEFVTPLLLEDPALCSRPITYLHTQIQALDGKEHQFTIRIIADDEICLDRKEQWDTEFQHGDTDNYTWGSVGSVIQNPLNKSGDDLRIDWGYLYLAVKKDSSMKAHTTKLLSEEATATSSGQLELTIKYSQTVSSDTLIAVAYDDIKSMEYFGEALEPTWKTSDIRDIHSAINVALNDFHDLLDRCNQFSKTLSQEAEFYGGPEYAELLSLAYRQAIAAHKLCTGPDGKLLFISKECFSNGCAATVDVSYPSAPLFLMYNPELVKGMLRPIFHYASLPEWPYNFAPHDAGQYPKVNGQVYADNRLEDQMPIEECGNILILITAISIIEKDLSFALEHWPHLEKWADYLLATGMDPENQLCTDDFAGHLAHNCNLSIKAIMGITGFSLLCRMNKEYDRAEELLKAAKTMAERWMVMAAKPDGTFRLAFDQENSYSMKYNLIWDKLWGTKVFDFSQFQKELDSYLTRSNQFGMPLDNRADYTKSDWLVWCAALMNSKTDFMRMIAPLYAAYHNSESRVPMTDWYDTKTAKIRGFQNRTVQGGLFIRLLDQMNICNYSEL